MIRRGYFGIGIYGSKSAVNIGTLWRSAYAMGAHYIFTVGRRYSRQASDTVHAPRHVPLFNFASMEELHDHLPQGCRLVGVELAPEARSIRHYAHPEQACYLLGAEDWGLPPKVLQQCHHLIQLPGKYCLNVSTAGSIVMYDRWAKSSTNMEVLHGAA